MGDGAASSIGSLNTERTVGGEQQPLDQLIGQLGGEPLASCKPGRAPSSMVGYVIRRERQGEIAKAYQIETVETPQPGPGEVLVLIMAAGINFNGIWAALGKPVSVFDTHKHPFHITGTDGSGIIWQVGPGVTHWRVGDEVVLNGTRTCGQCNACSGFDPMACEHLRAHGYETPYGTFAQFTLVQSRQLLPKPPQHTWEEAASYGASAFTAYRMLDRAAVKPGESVLIWGAAGGLGCFAIQLTRLRGGIAIAVVSSDDKAQLARELGADVIINRRDFPGLAYKPNETEAETKQRMDATKAMGRAITQGLGDRGLRGRGADVVFEHIGQETLPASIFLAARMGRIVTCGATSGYNISFDIRHLWMKQKTLIGSHISNLEDATRANELMIKGKLRPVMTKLLPYSQLREAHEEMQGNNKLGNVVCLVASPKPGLHNWAEVRAAAG